MELLELYVNAVFCQLNLLIEIWSRRLGNSLGAVTDWLQDFELTSSVSLGPSSPFVNTAGKAKIRNGRLRCDRREVIAYSPLACCPRDIGMGTSACLGDPDWFLLCQTEL